MYIIGIYIAEIKREPITVRCNVNVCPSVLLTIP